MGRAISFDYDRALDQATLQFWKTGYAGTSIRDLLKATGLGEGSFYNTLKSKKHLYLACLKRYAETEGRKRTDALTTATTAAAGIRAMFAVMLDCLDDPRTPSRLCMMAAMASEEVLADDDLKAVAEKGMADFCVGLTGLIQRDREREILPADLDPATTALIVITFAQGFWRVAMVDYDRPALEKQIDQFLLGLRIGS